MHVDPVITVNDGVQISANGSEPMPLLATLLPPSPPPTIPGGTALLGSDADSSPVTALPPATPEENAAFNAGH